MISITVNTNGKKVLDSFKKYNTNLQEVAVTLLRLKQIEQELLNIDFENDLEVIDEDKESN